MTDKAKEKEISVDVFNLLLSQDDVCVVKIQSGFLDEVKHVASHLRKQDYAEVWRSSGACPRLIVRRCWLTSELKWITFYKKKPVAISGVVRDSDLVGVPWMVATDGFHNDEVEDYFLKHSKEYIQQIYDISDFKILTNCIDAENTRAIKWLEWCGAIMGDTILHGPFKKEFKIFHLPNLGRVN